jgi:predicted O-methyltransferase YrrM
LKRAIGIGGAAVALACVVFSQRRGPAQTAPESEANPPLAKTDAEKKILATLNDIVRAGTLYNNVPAADGRMLRLLAESANARNVVEIGTSTGISGLWLSLALDKTGGMLTTFEIDPGRASTARANFKKAGVDRIVTIVEGDAHQNITRIKDPVDVVFIDADKEGYVDYLTKLLPLVRPGGLLVAHNVGMVPEYMKAVTSNPDLETIVYMHLKKR